MILVRKRRGKTVKAYQLGTRHPVLDRLIAEGRLLCRPDGSYFITTREATAPGEVAKAGDYLKIDPAGYPYPNSRLFFEANHRHLQGDDYEQLPRPMAAWTADEALCEEICFLVEHKHLVLHPDDPSHYFTAPLWGTVEHAPRDAVLVFYHIEREEETGRITDCDFNFVDRRMFAMSYEILPPAP